MNDDITTLTPRRKRGHPVTVYTPERVEQLLQLLDEYIETTEIPIVSEFAFKNGMHREQMYQIPELAYSIKRLITKKEYALEIGLLTKTLSAPGAIFSLKQLGWKDNIELSGSVDIATGAKDDLLGRISGLAARSVTVGSPERN